MAVTILVGKPPNLVAKFVPQLLMQFIIITLNPITFVEGASLGSFDCSSMQTVGKENE